MHRTSSKSISVWFWQLLTLIWKSLQILTVAFVDFFEMSNVTSDFVCRAKKMCNAKVLIWYYSSKSGVPLLNLFRKFLSGNAIILAHNNLPELFVLYHYLGGAALQQKCPQAHCWKRNFAHTHENNSIQCKMIFYYFFIYNSLGPSHQFFFMLILYREKKTISFVFLMSRREYVICRPPT